MGSTVNFGLAGRSSSTCRKSSGTILRSDKKGSVGRTIGRGARVRG